MLLPTFSGRGMLSTVRARAPASEGCAAEPVLLACYVGCCLS